jgi:hypothetical protein
MKKLINNTVSVFIFSFLLVACDSTQERQKKTMEDRLLGSFEQSEEKVRDRVSVIVSASKEKKYILAMNELGILAKTNMNNTEQKQAIKLLMSQLRIAMESEELKAKRALQ